MLKSTQPLSNAFFISDLHLSKNVIQVNLLFRHFIQNIIQPGDTLFILGDFFEYWLGEDLIDFSQYDALSALKKLHEEGSQIYFIRGNRDFLIKTETLERFGIQLLSDPCIYMLGSVKLLLSHGDLLCTEDIAYQRYKKFAQHKIIKKLFLKLPRQARLWVANKVHKKNPHAEFLKNPEYRLADANRTAIIQLIEKIQPDIFMYGHVHKMAMEHHGNTTRMVLGDWYNTGNYIQISSGKAIAKSFDLNLDRG